MIWSLVIKSVTTKNEKNELLIVQYIGLKVYFLP